MANVFHVEGRPLSSNTAVAAAAGNATAIAERVNIVASGTGGVTLPSAATVGAGDEFIIHNSTAAAITVATAGTETINGSATLSVGAGTTARIVKASDTAWVA